MIPRGLLPANVPSWACASGGGTTPVGCYGEAESCGEPRADHAAGIFAQVESFAVPVPVTGAAGAPATPLRPMWRGRRALAALCDISTRGKRTHRHVHVHTQPNKVRFGDATFIQLRRARVSLKTSNLLLHVSSSVSSAGAHMACDEVGSAGADRPAGARMGRDGAGVAGAFYGVHETGYVSVWSYLFAFMSFSVIYLLSCYFHV